MTPLTALNYTGHINTTINGDTCRYWKYGAYYKDEEQNYCRTPLGDLDNAGGPWCYTDAVFRGWDRCKVLVCRG